MTTFYRGTEVTANEVVRSQAAKNKFIYRGTKVSQNVSKSAKPQKGNYRGTSWNAYLSLES